MDLRKTQLWVKYPPQHWSSLSTLQLHEGSALNLKCTPFSVCECWLHEYFELAVSEEWYGRVDRCPPIVPQAPHCPAAGTHLVHLLSHTAFAQMHNIILYALSHLFIHGYCTLYIHTINIPRGVDFLYTITSWKSAYTWKGFWVKGLVVANAWETPMTIEKPA